MLYISLLFALIAFGVSAHLNQLHHTAIFVRQDVAMLHVEAGKINEAAAHLEVARVQGLILVFRIWNDAVSVFFTCRDCESVPPDKIFVELQELLSGWAVRIVEFGYLEWVYVNVERMRNSSQILVDDRPLLGGIKGHHLINVPVYELPVVYIELTRSAASTV